MPTRRPLRGKKKTRSGQSGFRHPPGAFEVPVGVVGMLGVQLLGGLVAPAVALCPGTLFAPPGVGMQLAPLAGALGLIVGTELLPGVV
jgi:hypothetical protein